MTLGTMARGVVMFLDLPELIFTVSCHICAILNGFSGILLCSTPPAISAAWFPPNERVTATSIGQTLNCLGGGLVYLLAGLLVETDNTETSSRTDNCHFINTTHSTL